MLSNIIFSLHTTPPSNRAINKQDCPWIARTRQGLSRREGNHRPVWDGELTTHIHRLHALLVPRQRNQHPHVSLLSTHWNAKLTSSSSWVCYTFPSFLWLQWESRSMKNNCGFIKRQGENQLLSSVLHISALPSSPWMSDPMGSRSHCLEELMHPSAFRRVDLNTPLWPASHGCPSQLNYLKCT